MDKTCYACHGSRYAGEYMGKLTPVPDVHYAEKQMECVDCHTGEQLHHTKPDGVKRYYATETPRCEQCHPDAESGSSRVAMHNAHPKDTLACTVCHANEYFNCTNCHVSLDVKEAGKQTCPVAARERGAEFTAASSHGGAQARLSRPLAPAARRSHR